MNPGEWVGLAARFATATARGSRRPRPLETVDEWGARVLGPRATRWLVGPTLQGMYAGDPAHLSASLVYGARERAARRARKGLLAPAGGMQELINALESRLRTRDVTIRLNAPARLDGSTPTVICTSARDAAECLRDVAPAASQALSTIDMLPLVRITAFYPEEERIRGAAGSCFRAAETSARSASCSTRTSFPTAEGSTPRVGFTGALRIVTSCTSPKTIWGR